MSLSNELGGERPVNKYIFSSIAALGSSLVRLELVGFDNIPDQTFGALLKRLPSLQNLNLRYILFTYLHVFDVVLNDHLRPAAARKSEQRLWMAPLTAQDCRISTSTTLPSHRYPSLLCYCLSKTSLKCSRSQEFRTGIVAVSPCYRPEEGINSFFLASTDRCHIFQASGESRGRWYSIVLPAPAHSQIPTNITYRRIYKHTRTHVPCVQQYQSRLYRYSSSTMCERSS